MTGIGRDAAAIGAAAGVIGLSFGAIAVAHLGKAGRLHLGVARPVGVLVGAILAWRKAPFVVVVIAAAGTAALLRLLTGVP